MPGEHGHGLVIAQWAAAQVHSDSLDQPLICRTQELFTFDGAVLRANIALSLLGSTLYIVGSVVGRLPYDTDSSSTACCRTDCHALCICLGHARTRLLYATYIPLAYVPG